MKIGKLASWQVAQRPTVNESLVSCTVVVIDGGVDTYSSETAWGSRPLTRVTAPTCDLSPKLGSPS